MSLGCGGEVSGTELGERLVRLRNGIDMLELEFSRMASDFAQTDEYDEQGFDSPISWLKESCHMPGGAAADRVCAGEQLERLGESRAAQARQRSVASFRNACMHARHAADKDGFVDEEKQGVEARSLTMSTADDGTVLINCILDKVGGAAVRTALEPLARRAGKDDDRLRDRRLADAFVDLAMHALDTGLVPQRTHLSVTTSLETLLGLTGAPAAEMEFSLPISAKAVERLACDCSVTRILLGSDSTVIDVGRARRVISGPQRKALKVRDGGCVVPGCDRPASWTEGHHLVHWIHNGPGDLANLVLLCYRHHWMVHEGGSQLVRTDDGRMLIVPAPTGFGPRPRGPD